MIHPFVRWPLSIACLLSAQAQVSGEDWPQWRGPARDGVWHATNVRHDLPDGQLPLAWQVEVGPGYTGPTVADGRVFVMDRQATSGNDQKERILAFRSTDGEPLWHVVYNAPYTISYTAGPRASVTIDGPLAYAVGAMGHFHCLRVETGEIVWQRDLNQQYSIDMPIWGIAASPLIYGNLVIQQVGGSEGACMVAFDKLTGEEKWRALRERAGYASPMLIRQADQEVLVCWTGDSVSGLNPENGQVHWSQPFPPSRMPIGIMTPITDGKRLFVSSFYDGSLMLRLAPDRMETSVLWRASGPDEQNTESLHTMIGTPILQGEQVYGVDSYGQFRCLDADTGTRLWEDTRAVPVSRWATIHMVRQAGTDRVWMFNERGDLLITELQPEGLRILDRCHLIDPTEPQLPRRGGVCWSHPAFAEQSVFARSDRRLVRASLREP